MARLVRLLGLGLVLCGLLGPAQTAGASPTPRPSTTGGLFVIAGTNPAVGQQVEFWGAQWARANPLISPAPDAFKGFADIVQPGATAPCTGTFEARPGDSAAPPTLVSGDITVLVANLVTQLGNTISGTYTGLVTVKVESDYAADPGHPGVGIVVGPACTSGTTTGGGGTT